jgi:hypothetical protein
MDFVLTLYSGIIPSIKKIIIKTKGVVSNWVIEQFSRKECIKTKSDPKIPIATE